MQHENRQRVLILTPFGRDAVLLCKVLTGQGFECEACETVEKVITELITGAEALLVTEEVLRSKSGSGLLEYLKKQPSWSALPVIAFYGKRTRENDIEKKDHHPLQAHTEITFLERPVSMTTLVSATRAALRDRARQYQVKRLLENLESELVKKAQNEIELVAAKQAAEVASQSKSQFLANMSHEIRTPLGAIMGFAELMQEEDQSEDDRKESLETIVRNGRQLANLVNDLLDIAKVEAGRMETELIEFRLADLVLEIEKLFYPVAASKGLKLEVEFIKPFPERIISDPTRLRQILINLIGNSLKFTSRGTVRIRVEQSPPSHGGNEVGMTFKISDTGPGMNQAERSRIFETFVQGDASTTRKFGGTGLGLTLSRDLAKLLGGTLRVGSTEVGVGTEMVLEISAGTEAQLLQKSPVIAPTEKSDGAPSRALNGLDILLVEDSSDIQSLISRILESNGAHVDLASDGEEGVAKASSHEYDLVLMDIQMPNKDGYSAARELRDLGFARPMVAITAHAMREDRDKSVRAGFSGYLTKPINRAQLIATISSQCKLS